MKFNTLLTDLDDTIIKSGKVYDKALRFASRFFSEKYNLDHETFYKTVAEKHFIVSKNFPTVHTRHSRILVFRMALDEHLENFDLALLPDAEDIYWDYFIRNIELYPHATESIKKIRDAGAKVAVVSDGDLSLRIRKVKAAGLISIIDEVVASEEVIFEKPFSAIFTLALSRLKSNPADAVMIGNDYKNDVRGAQLVGIKGILFHPPEDSNTLRKNKTIVPDFEVEDWSEVPDIFGI